MKDSGMAAVVVVWLSVIAKAESNFEPAHLAAQYQRPVPSVQAQVPPQTELAGVSRIPQLGFHSTFGFAHGVLGEHVTQVRLGSAADRLGLSAGDVILAVNGQPLRTAESWSQAVQRAAGQDGWVTLKVLERRSGATAYRTANLFKLNPR